MSDYTPPPAPPAPPMTPMAPGGAPSSNAKLIALLGWIFAPLGIIAIFLDDYKNDMFVRAHVIQAAALVVIVWVLNAILSATVVLALIALPLGLLVFIYQIFLAIQAYNGKSVEVPVIYGFVKNFINQVG
jgi:uncharacterized membrane protein